MTKIQRVPLTYKSLDCCKNCKFVFVREERKAPTEYYCTFDGLNRPLCGSIKMGESEMSSKDFSWKKWAAWKKTHLIEDEYGKCNEYKKE